MRYKLLHLVKAEITQLRMWPVRVEHRDIILTIQQCLIAVLVKRLHILSKYHCA